MRDRICLLLRNVSSFISYSEVGVVFGRLYIIPQMSPCVSLVALRLIFGERGESR